MSEDMVAIRIGLITSVRSFPDSSEEGLTNV
jgi:hypothetical protein